jgi:hypothetical protein
MNRKTVNNMPWYTILYGDFSTPAEAREAIKQLPAEIQAYGPFVRSIKSIKNSENPELHKNVIKIHIIEMSIFKSCISQFSVACADKYRLIL